jgi:hypothetical protein
MMDNPPVDRSRMGVLQISKPALANLLRLPAGIAVERCSYDSYREVFLVVFVGEPMPQMERGLPKSVGIVMEENRETPGFRRLYMSWEHRPDVRWLHSMMPLEEGP